MWTCWSSKGKVILVVKALSGGLLGSFGSSPLVTPQLRASPAHLSGTWAAGVLWDHGVCTLNLHLPGAILTQILWFWPLPDTKISLCFQMLHDGVTAGRE